MSDVEPPWRKSKSGNVYCRLNSVPNNIKPNLKVHDKYVTVIREYSYKVRVFDDNVLVFREPIGVSNSIGYCKICAQYGYPNIRIKWRKINEKWIPLEFDNPDEPHTHRGVEYEEYTEMEFL